MEAKEKHPSWFKMKTERRELIRQLPPETAVQVILACWDYLETGERPGALPPIGNIAFSAFMPDLEEAWKRYLQRISARKPNGEEPTDTDRIHTVSSRTEEETETEKEEDSRKERAAAKRPARPRFLPPTVEQVAEYVKQRGSRVDPQGFLDFYAAKGWMIGRTPMKDWKAACRNAESWERWQRPDARNSVKTASDYDGGESFV